MSKLRKLIKQPGVFLRDYLNKRYPVVNNEQGFVVEQEPILIDGDLQLLSVQTHLVKTSVDVVFTWVNHKDAKWRKQFNHYAEKTTQDSVGLYALDTARFENHDELKFSIYSVLKYLPWVRNIFIVTDGQRPSWDIVSEKIIFVSHAQIINKSYLPTFNSHVIEAHLHKIPGLSEDFIYFNDDVFVARPLPKSHFFKDNGLASLFVAKKSLKKLLANGIKTVTLSASITSNKLLQRYDDINIDHPLVHTYIPLKKSMYEYAWLKYEKEINSFLVNKFRSHNDLNMASFLVPWLMYIRGQSVISREICYYFNIRSNNALLQYKNLIKKKELSISPHSFCANDFHSSGVGLNNYKEELSQFLNSYFVLYNRMKDVDSKKS